MRVAGLRQQVQKNEGLGGVPPRVVIGSSGC